MPCRQAKNAYLSSWLKFPDQVPEVLLVVAPDLAVWLVGASSPVWSNTFQIEGRAFDGGQVEQPHDSVDKGGEALAIEVHDSLKTVEGSPGALSR